MPVRKVRRRGALPKARRGAASLLCPTAKPPAPCPTAKPPKSPPARQRSPSIRRCDDQIVLACTDDTRRNELSCAVLRRVAICQVNDRIDVGGLAFETSL